MVNDLAAHDGDHVALFIHIQTAGKTVVQHIGIVVHVVDGDHQGLFAGGQIDVLEDRLAVHDLHHVGDVIEDEAGFLQQRQHGFELGDGGHKVVVTGLFPVAVKGFGSVGHQTVEEDVVILAALVFHQAFLGLFHILQQGGGGGVGELARIGQQLDGVVIIVTLHQPFGLVQQLLALGLDGGVVHRRRGGGIVGLAGLVLLLLALAGQLVAEIGEGILVVQRPHQGSHSENQGDDGHHHHDQNHGQLYAAAVMGVFSFCHILSSCICKRIFFVKDSIP